MATNESAEVPGALRLMVKVWGTFSALVCIGFSVFVMMTFNSRCLAMGGLMLGCGLSVLSLEAPILHFKIEGVTKISQWLESNLKYWMKAAFYLSLSLPAIIFCPEVSTFLGAGAVLITAAFYGVMAIGKKGTSPTSTMKNEADVEMKETLVDGKGDPRDTGIP